MLLLYCDVKILKKRIPSVFRADNVLEIPEITFLK